MSEDELGALADELADDDYVSGRRPFPRPLLADEAADLALALSVEVERGAAARAQAAALRLLPIVCARGCNGCCEELIMVFLPEAQAAARWLLLPENDAARERFLQAYPAWRAAAADAPARLGDLLAQGDGTAYVAAHQAQWRRRLLCAFNQDGDCSIYPVRPMACRNAHAIETSTRCVGDSVGPPAARLSFPPLDQYLRSADKVLQAAHHALGGALRRPTALCDSVCQILTDNKKK